MKNKLLFAFLFLCSFGAYSQVGIGTPMPNSSAQLEVVASDKGILIPRINLTGSTDATTIKNGNINSLLVFNTATISDITPGYYYWYANKWNRIVISTETSSTPGTVIYNPVNQTFSYIDASGNPQIINISAIVKANETVTTLVNNGAGSYTYTNESGAAVNIDVVGDVTSNFSTIVNNPAVTNIIQDIVKKTEGNVTYNSTTNQFSYVDASGNTQIIDISTIVKANETVTTQSQNLISGAITYTNETGTTNTSQVISTDSGNLIKVGTDGGSLLSPTELTNATTVSNTSSVNSLNTTVNGVSGTGVNIINSNETSLTGSALTTTVNGVSSTALDLGPAITAGTTNALSLAGNTLTSNVNGISSTSDAVSGVSNASTVNTSTVTVNGITSSGAPIINTNETSLTGSTLTTTVNGVASTALDLSPAIAASQIITDLVQDTGTGVITYTNENAINQTANVTSTDAGNILTVGTDGGTLLSATAITNATTVSNTSAVNTLNTTVNGITGTGVNIINSNETSLTGSALTTTVNGVASIALDLGPAITAGTTNALSLAGNTLTSNVNGISSTSDAVSGVSNASAVNTSTVTVNGITSSGAPIINTNETSLTGLTLTTTVNGVASTPLDLGPAITAGTTNTLTAVNGNLISTVNGVATTPAVPVLITADNALTATNGNVQLGGTLIIPTTIAASSNNTLAVTGLQAGVATDNIIVADNAGILKIIAPGILNANNWNILGNAGTNPTINFIGTTDDNDLVFRRDNDPAGRLNSNNTALGMFSFNPASTGTYDVAIGRYTLANNTTGFNNTAIGDYAAYLNTTGGNNTANGHIALYSNTTGDGNTASGYGALYANIDGSNNTAYGTAAGNNNTTGSNNTFLGYLSNITTSGLNLTNATAIGYNAKVAASNSLVLGGTAASAVNVGIGNSTPTNALHVTPVSGLDPVRFEGLLAGAPTDNIVVADATGVLKTISSASLNATNWNTIGNAGTNAATNFLGTTDNVNLAFRRNNIPAGRIEIDNVSLGVNALNISSAGIQNVAIGASALPVNTSGGSNTALGAYTLFTNTTGASNTASGTYSLSKNTTGSYNTGTGIQSMQENTTGNNNTAIGYSSLANYISGDNNTALGSAAGAFSVSGSGSGNTFIGSNSNTTNGVNINNATAIGNKSKVATSNSLVLGAIGTDAVNVGIGTDSPTNTLHVTPVSGLNPVRFEGLLAGVPTDNIVVADPTGVLKTITPGSLIPTTTVSNASLGNTATVTVNSVTSTGAPIINTNATSLTGASLITTVNGIASTALDLTPAINAATTNTLTALNGNLISTVNGVATTPAVPVLTTADNGLTATNGNVQLGGTLVTPTTIETDFSNTLAIKGLMQGTPMDEVLIVDPNGVIRTIKQFEINFNDWSTFGNMGTSPQVNFLGTIDDNNLVFKRNNVKSGLIGLKNTSLGAGTFSQLNSDDVNQSVYNVAIGDKALETMTIGFANNAIGSSAMNANTTGSENTAVGFQALTSNTIGGQNTTLGNFTLQSNTTGNRNTAIGYYSGFNGLSGEDITLLGAFTTFTDNISNATAIGSGAHVDISNSIILGGPKINVGIGTSAPTNALHVIPDTNLDPIRFEGLQPSISGTDNIIVADPTGVLKTITASELTANSWNTLGNIGTNATINFLGTIDNVNLVFKRNNTPAGRIELNNTSFGVNALNVSSTGLYNVALGTSALPVNTSGEANTSLGGYTLFSNTTGSNNTASGTYALTANTTGSFNTATGLLSMQENETGNHNAALGYAALAAHQSGDNNTAVGSGAGGLGAVGTGNTFIGNNANATNGVNISNATAIGLNSKVATSNSLVLGGISTDAVNVGIGTDAPTNTLHIKPLTGINPVRVEGLQPSASSTDNVVVADATGLLKTIPRENNWSTIGNAGIDATVNFIGTTTNADLIFKRGNLISGKLSGGNTSFGVNALSTAGTGSGNVAIGVNALRLNTVGFINVAIGNDVLTNSPDGFYNIGIGGQALRANTNGYSNLAIGFQSLTSNTTGNDNIALGSASLNANTVGISNLAMGYSSIPKNITGNDNIGIGRYTLNGNTSGIENIAIGQWALGSILTTSFNTAVGTYSLNGNITGTNNAALGSSALKQITSGNSNVAVGFASAMYINDGTTVATSADTSVFLGANTKPLDNAQTNQVVIGYNAIGRGSNTVQIGNDLMTSIGGQVAWSNPSDQRLKKDIVTSSYGLNFINKLRPVTYKMKSGTKDLQTGFIAQEVETAAKEINYEFSGIVKPATSKDFYSLRYSEFVVPLVKAVQEQQTQIELKDKEIQDLKKLTQQMDERLKHLEKLLEKDVTK